MTTNTLTYLTRAELAGILKTTPRTISKLIKGGKLPVVRIGRQIRIPVESIARLFSGKL